MEKSRGYPGIGRLSKYLASSLQPHSPFKKLRSGSDDFCGRSYGSFWRQCGSMIGHAMRFSVESGIYDPTVSREHQLDLLPKN